MPDPHATTQLLSPTRPDQLAEIFRRSERPAAQWLVGMESEKFGIFGDGSPLPYSGERSIQTLFSRLGTRGWEPGGEYAGAPIIYLKQGERNITLEPGGQFELSGSPFDNVHQVATEYHAHLAELAEISTDLDLFWIHLGFHPLAKRDALPWVPKARYGVMKEYLPTQGPRALDMMQRTATVQVNLDYSSEADAMKKLVVLLKLTPLLQSMAANAPFIEGRRSPRLSERLDVWLNMDPRRSGLIAELWDLPEPRYEDYVRWALRAGMFMLRRDSGNVLNVGQSFEDFLRNGYQGERATANDWQIHLGSLFPEVRLKTTIEVRGFDAVPPELAPAIPALLVGLAYDPRSLDEAAALVEGLDPVTAVQLQREVSEKGLAARWNGRPLQELAGKLLDLATAGLSRRARLNADGLDESIHLLPLRRLVAAGLTPADELVSRFRESRSVCDLFLAR